MGRRIEDFPDLGIDTPILSGTPTLTQIFTEGNIRRPKARHYSDHPHHKSRSDYWREIRQGQLDMDDPGDKSWLFRRQMFRDTDSGR